MKDIMKLSPIAFKMYVSRWATVLVFGK